jgi:hypothetical protein
VALVEAPSAAPNAEMKRPNINGTILEESARMTAEVVRMAMEVLASVRSFEKDVCPSLDTMTSEIFGRATSTPMPTTPSGESKMLVSAKVQPKFLLMYWVRVVLAATKRTCWKKKVIKHSGMLMFLSIRSDRFRSLRPWTTCSLRVIAGSDWCFLALMVRVSGMKTKIAKTMGIVQRTTAMGVHGSKRSIKRPAMRGPRSVPPEAPRER